MFKNFILSSFVFILVGCNGQSKNDSIIVYNTDSIRTSIRMTQPEGNLTFIDATVKGKKVTFLLDSGAGSTVIDKDQLDEFGLTYVNAGSEFQGVGGSNQLYIVTNLDEITIDGRNLSVDCKASNLSNVVNLIYDASGIHIIGILGSDFFTNHKVIFDYGEKIFFIPE